MGAGWQEIVASEAYSSVDLRLDFGAQGRARARFDIRGDRLGSSVSWSFDTDVTEGSGFLGGVLGRWFGLFYDRWIGQDYERGLAAFKAYAETLPPEDFSGADIQVLEVAPQTVVSASGVTGREPAAIADALAEAFGEIMDFVYADGLEVSGQPLAISRARDEAGYRFEAAIPITAPADVAPPGRLSYAQSPSGRAVRIVHVGPYDATGRSYDQASAFMAAHGLQDTGLSWEHYVTDPADSAPADIVTHIYFLLASPD